MFIGKKRNCERERERERERKGNDLVGFETHIPAKGQKPENRKHSSSSWISIGSRRFLLLLLLFGWTGLEITENTIVIYRQKGIATGKKREKEKKKINIHTLHRRTVYIDKLYVYIYLYTV
jgi:hypothetical protein